MGSVRYHSQTLFACLRAASLRGPWTVGWVFGLGSTIVSFWMAFLLLVVKQENYERVNVNEYIW